MNDEMMMMISRLAEAGSRGVVQDSGGSKSIEAMLAQIANTGSMGVLRDVGESKSIDDIINQSNIAEFLSKAMSDKTNVDSSEIPIDNLDDKSNYYDRGFTRAETEKLKALKEQRRKDKLRFGYQFRDSPLHIINNFFGSEEKDEELILEERGRK